MHLIHASRDQKCFIYLRGWVPDIEGLDKVRLRWSTQRPADYRAKVPETPFVVEMPLAIFEDVAIRQGGKRDVRELKPGEVEFIVDFQMDPLFLKKGTYMIGIALVVPGKGGEKVLLSFEGPLLVE